MVFKVLTGKDIPKGWDDQLEYLCVAHRVGNSNYYFNALGMMPEDDMRELMLNIKVEK